MHETEKSFSNAFGYVCYTRHVRGCVYCAAVADDEREGALSFAVSAEISLWQVRPNNGVNQVRTAVRDSARGGNRAEILRSPCGGLFFKLHVFTRYYAKQGNEDAMLLQMPR